MTSFAILGLLLILSVNQINSRTFLVSKTLESLKNESSVLRIGIDTLKNNAKDLNSNANIDLFIKMGLEIASKLVPLPIRPLLALATSIFSSYYNNSKNAKTNVTQEQLSREIKELGNRISIESQRIIDEIKRTIVEHRLKQDLQETLDSLDQDWDTYSGCFLTDDCPDEIQTDALNQTLIPSSDFRKKLTLFVRKFINQKEHEHSVVYPRDGFFKFVIEDCERLVRQIIILGAFFYTKQLFGMIFCAVQMTAICVRCIYGAGLMRSKIVSKNCSAKESTNIFTN